LISLSLSSFLLSVATLNSHSRLCEEISWMRASSLRLFYLNLSSSFLASTSSNFFSSSSLLSFAQSCSLSAISRLRAERLNLMVFDSSSRSLKCFYSDSRVFL